MIDYFYNCFLKNTVYIKKISLMALCGIAFLSSSFACNMQANTQDFDNKNNFNLVKMQKVRKKQSFADLKNKQCQNESAKYSKIQSESSEDSKLSQNSTHDLDFYPKDGEGVSVVPVRVTSISNNFIPRTMLAMFILSSLIDDSFGMTQSQVGGGTAVNIGWNVVIGVTILWFWIYSIVFAAKAW